MKRSLLSPLAMLLVAAASAPVAGHADLIEATRQHDTASVQSMLMGGANVDTADAHGNTALMMAAACGYTDLAELLLAHGADVRARGYIGNTALIYATQEGHADIAQMLVARGASPAARNDYGNSAARLAAQLGHRDVAAAFTAETTRAPLAAPDLAHHLAELVLLAVTVVGVPAITAGTLYSSLQPHRSRASH